MLTVEKSHNLTETELNQIVFKGATDIELRGLRETLGDDVVSNLGEHPSWEYFSKGFKAWIFEAWNEMLEEQLAS